MISLSEARKGFSKSLIAVSIGAVLAASQVALADNTTGAIRGSVVNVEKSDKVRVTNLSRGVSRDISISDKGEFRVGSLPPGKYQLELLSGDEVTETRLVSVSLGGTVNVLLGDSSQMEEVVVNGQPISQRDIGIAESGLVISSDEIIELPVARNLNSITLLAPSVSKGDRTFDQFGGGTSFAGSSIAENVSYINGLNTTNFRNGLGYSTVPFEFYDNIQVKTGGYSAKFGRSTGGVMNATTKSGSNEFKFGTSVYYDEETDTAPNTFVWDNDKDVLDTREANIYASGAIIEDRLFFYALYSNVVENQEYYGITSGRGYKEETKSDFWGVKLDGYINEDHRVEFTAFSDERDIVEGIYNYDSDTGKTGDYIGDIVYGRGGHNWIASYIGNLNDSMTLSISYGENSQDRSEVPGNDEASTVYWYNPGRVSIGNWVGSSVEVGEDTREMFRVDFSWTIDDHMVEVGIDNEVNSLTENTSYSGGEIWRLYPELGRARQLIYENVGSFETESSAIYLQDTWQITDDWSVQFGLRNETFTNKNAAGKEFIDISDQWAPRFSTVWDPSGDGRQKVFASAGLYYLPVASNTNVRLAGAELYTSEWFDWESSCLNNDATPCNLGDSDGLFYFADGSLKDTRSVVDKNIDPMYQSEYILGYEYFLDNGIQLGVRGIYRNLEVALEDLAIDAAVISHYTSTGTWDASKVGGASVEDVFGGFHQYVLTNPGNDMRIYIPEQGEYINLSAAQLGYPEAKRQYGAVEFTFKRPFDGRWSLDASYTWGHSWGNNEGYVRSDNGQTDSGLTTNFDQPGLLHGGYGDLPNDRRHTIKAFGTYSFDMGLRLGANFMWQTGRPKNCFGMHPTDDFAAEYGSESFYCQGRLNSRGSLGRTENYWNLDLNAQYPVELANNQKLLVSLDVFNIFNNDSVVEIEEKGDLDGTAEAYEYFGDPYYYQTPRSVRLGLRYDFN
ncbi:TonB-dependent receptor domain-containing protein [Microbulbifer echini]|uniref:TonB-dependent receptor domain-containing protein n=1 Tax=Microbulbifer echini TaxID=1529067 RepID=A0ABV4NIJ4_9GAMM|nr:TonB-dependent receptor [uncultured Microbulbifer sp.]